MIVPLLWLGQAGAPRATPEASYAACVCAWVCIFFRFRVGFCTGLCRIVGAATARTFATELHRRAPS